MLFYFCMKQILLVDNEQPVLHSLSKILENNRLIVRTAASGGEAIRKASACPFALCFIDLHLSDMDSRNVIRQIRALSPETGIIVMSASFIESSVKEELEEDVYLFIPKPADLQQIETVIRHLMQDDRDVPPLDAVCGERSIEEKRMFKRRRFEKTVSCTATHLDLFETRCLVLEARIFDLSHGGVGMQTCHLLPPGCEIRFSDDAITGSRGVVMNSTPADHGLFRIGVAFR